MYEVTFSLLYLFRFTLCFVLSDSYIELQMIKYNMLFKFNP